MASNMVQVNRDQLASKRGMKAKLYLAASKGSLKDINSEPWENQMTPMGNTVLHVHVGRPLKEGKTISIEFIEMVLNHGSGYSLLWHKNANEDIPLQLASRFGHDKAVREFIQRVKAVSEEEVRKMLTMTNKRKDTPLHDAARGGYDEVVKLLVDADPNSPHDPNDLGETPLYLAAESGSTACVASILDICPSSALAYNHRGPCGRTALHAAVQWGTPDMVQNIIEKDGSLISIQDDEGRTPLHCVAGETKTQLLEVLLSYDKEATESAVYIQDKEGRTPLHIATLHCNWNRIKELIASRPDCIEIVDNKGQNVVHYAANWACIRKFEDFFKLGVGDFRKLINEKDVDGNTPLHLLAASLPYVTCPCLFGAQFFMGDQRQHYLKAFNNRNFTVGDILASHNIKEHIELAVTKRVAPRGRRNGKERNLVERAAYSDVRKARMAHLKDTAQSRLVVAALIATVSFTAGFTIPGGYNQNSGPDIGMAVLTKKAAFKAFLVSDAIAFTCSSFAVLIYFFLASFTSPWFHLFVSNVASLFNVVSMGAMMIAFVTGVYAVVSRSPGLVIAVLFICGVFLFYYVAYFIRTLVFGAVYVNSCYIRDPPV